MMLKKNAQRTLVFVMIDSADTRLVKTGLTVTAQVSKDGASFNSSSNSVAEIANGFYALTLTATEMNADAVAVKLTASGAIQQNLVFYTAAKLVADLNDFNPAATDVDLSDADQTALANAIKGTPDGKTVKEVYSKADAAKAVADKLDTALELDGSVYRFTGNALEQGLPGSGVGDWTADERKQIRQALGVSGTAAATTGGGNLDVALDRLGELRAVPALETAAIVAAGQDIAFTRGDTQPIAFDLGRNITGASLKFTVKRRTTDPQSAALIAKSSAQVSQIAITQAAAGQFVVKLLAADTASLLPDGRRASFLYDVEMTLSSVVETIFAGSFILLPDVTTA